jgi:hypothetical protein
MGTLFKILKNSNRTKFETAVFQNWGFAVVTNVSIPKKEAKVPSEMSVITHVTSRCHSHEDHNPNYKNTIEYSIKCAPTIFKQGIHDIVIHISYVILYSA